MSGAAVGWVIVCLLGLPLCDVILSPYINALLLTVTCEERQAHQLNKHTSTLYTFVQLSCGFLRDVL